MSEITRRTALTATATAVAAASPIALAAATGLAEPAAAPALGGLAPGLTGDAELRRLWALYLEQDAAYTAAHERYNPARAALDAELPARQAAIADRSAYDRIWQTGWDKYGLQLLSDNWNDAHAAMLKTINAIQKTPAEGLRGIGIKLAALLPNDAHLDVIDYQVAVASALADINRVLGTGFVSYYNGIDRNRDEADDEDGDEAGEAPDAAQIAAVPISPEEQQFVDDFAKAWHDMWRLRRPA